MVKQKRVGLSILVGLIFAFFSWFFLYAWIYKYLPANRQFIDRRSIGHIEQKLATLEKQIEDIEATPEKRPHKIIVVEKNRVLSDSLTSAIVAGIVAIIVSSMVYFVTRKKKGAEKEKYEEKLYERRLEAYEHAFYITDDLSEEDLYKMTVTSGKLQDIRRSLNEWHHKKSFILSEESLKAFYEMRDSLAVEPPNGSEFSPEQIDRIWKAKNQFRKSLRRDVNMSYQEEPKPHIGSM
jgi:predicted RND superfamily exporter protein